MPADGPQQPTEDGAQRAGKANAEKAARERTEQKRIQGALLFLAAIALILVADFALGVLRRRAARKETQRIAANVENLPRADFEWKALWAHPVARPDEIRAMLDLTARMGCNVLIFEANNGHGETWYRSDVLPMHPGVPDGMDPLATVVEEAAKRGIQVYAWVITHVRTSEEFAAAHPEWLQQVTPEEEKLVGAPRANPDREPVHGPGWVCPDRGLLDYQKQILQEIVRNYGVAGVALDYLGYRNYHACFCEYSNAARAAYARAHREMNRERVLAEFSEDALVAWTEQAREAVREANPEAKVAIHIYPDFDPNPAYGNALDVDYCCQTVAWFYKPFWSYEKIATKAVAYECAAGGHRRDNRHVAFIGVKAGEQPKTPERLRKEIRIAGAAGTKHVMLAFHGTFAENPELAEVVREEFSSPAVAETDAE